MKFYRDKNSSSHYFYLVKAENNNLNAICIDSANIVRFLINRKRHNTKNASFYEFYEDKIYKIFYLNDEAYGNENEYDKQSWRKFVKLQVFI
jgi:hypothetical protein